LSRVPPGDFFGWSALFAPLFPLFYHTSFLVFRRCFNQFFFSQYVSAAPIAFLLGSVFSGFQAHPFSCLTCFQTLVFLFLPTVLVFLENDSAASFYFLAFVYLLRSFSFTGAFPSLAFLSKLSSSGSPCRLVWRSQVSWCFLLGFSAFGPDGLTRPFFFLHDSTLFSLPFPSLFWSRRCFVFEVEAADRPGFDGWFIPFHRGPPGPVYVLGRFFSSPVAVVDFLGAIVSCPPGPTFLQCFFSS